MTLDELTKVAKRAPLPAAFETSRDDSCDDICALMSRSARREQKLLPEHALTPSQLAHRVWLEGVRVPGASRTDLPKLPEPVKDEEFADSDEDMFEVALQLLDRAMWCLKAGGLHLEHTTPVDICAEYNILLGEIQEFVGQYDDIEETTK